MLASAVTGISIGAATANINAATTGVSVVAANANVTNAASGSSEVTVRNICLLPCVAYGKRPTTERGNGLWRRFVSISIRATTASGLGRRPARRERVRAILGECGRVTVAWRPID